VEVASFLVFDAGRLEVSRDDVIAEFRAASGGDFDPVALDLALIGGMVQLGCQCVIDVVLQGDEASRAKAEEELDWWMTRLRQAFETWAPS
jgi:hypothetical protein